MGLGSLYWMSMDFVVAQAMPLSVVHLREFPSSVCFRCLYCCRRSFLAQGLPRLVQLAPHVMQDFEVPLPSSRAKQTIHGVLVIWLCVRHRFGRSCKRLTFQRSHRR